jgi:hypothetical protein
MKTREVWRVLREHIEPLLGELGFEPFKDSSGQFLIWTRPRKATGQGTGKGRRYETVAFQADKWGWDPWRGSQFGVLMTRSRHRGNVALCREFATMWDLLTAEDKPAMEQQQNKVIARSRVPTEAEYNAHLGFPGYSNSEMRAYREACQPVDLSRHQSMGFRPRFIDAEDLEQWAQVLAAWIPRVLARDAEAEWVFGWGG